MNIYLDFEATQFGEHIIAIGAHCSLGDFDCLVKPPQGGKINKFITNESGEYYGRRWEIVKEVK